MATARALGPLCTGIAACFVSACGGGAALLHPAHVLGEGRVSAGAGMSGQFVLGKAADAIDSGAVASNGMGPSSDAEHAFLTGAASQSALAPGVAPWVGARAGLGGNNEGGLVYTGRAARVDARHAFGNDIVAVSFGFGASAVLMHPPSRHDAPTDAVTTAGRFTGSTNNLSATGWGLDVPVIVGWRSTASIVEAWAGVRGGVERIFGDLDITANGQADQASVTALRGYGGALAGAAIGFQPFSIALELDVAYQAVSAKAEFPSSAGAPSRTDATLSGITLAPSGAVIGKF